MSTSKTFTDLGITRALTSIAANLGIREPFPIQEESIPLILAGKDLIGVAPTGSGKTASFVLPMLQRIDGNTSTKNRRISALILAPTRELAAQIHEVVDFMSQATFVTIKSMAIYGGVSSNLQKKHLSDIDVVVATPGRLLEILSSNTLHLEDLKMLIVDEADKMLSLGFKDEMDQIFDLLPGRRQTLLYTATWSDDVADIADRLTKKAAKVEVMTHEEAKVKEQAYLVTAEGKGPFLRKLINENKWKSVLVFAASGRRADNIAQKLIRNGIKAASIHGKKSQGTRMKALKDFKDGEVQVLVATDLISRGIDIIELPVVINYELPRSPKDYVHRIGRTGRAHQDGESITLITEEDLHHFKIIQKKTGRSIDLEKIEQ